MVQEGVPNRAGAWPLGMHGTPADHHQVGAGGQAEQRPAGVAVHDVLADRYVGVLAPPAVEQCLKLPRHLRFCGVRLGWGERLARPGDVGLRRVPGVDGHQAGLAQARLLEREGERVTATVQVGDADADLPAGSRGLLAEDHDGTGRVAGDVPADRAEHQRRERAPAAGADDQHQRARPAVGDRLGGRPAQLVGVDQQAGGRLGSSFRRRGQGPVTVLQEHVGHVGVFLARVHARGHPGQQRRGGHDPKRGAAERGLPGGPVDRPK